MNIFEKDIDFVNLDNRKNRKTNICSAESLYNKFLVQLPAKLIVGKTILDLGSCLGAAGHWALTHNAKHYTGVEIQDYYFDTSNQLLLRYWQSSQFKIIKEDIEKFLDNEIANNKKYDYVIAAGITYGFLDVISLLKKIALVSKEHILIDTFNTSNSNQSNAGTIIIKKTNMIKANANELFYGYGSIVSLEAADIIMSTKSFYRDEPILMPKQLKKDIDPYCTPIKFPNGDIKPARYIARYLKKSNSISTLNSLVVTNDSSSIKTFDNQLEIRKNSLVSWKFDQNVANRFQQEAVNHIPDYHRVINLSVDSAKQHLSSNDLIIDVGSALGFTINEFIENGFNNVIGVESSLDMKNQSLYPEKVIHSDVLPTNNYQLVIMNWTLHFIENKINYLKTIQQNLNEGGILILTDKTNQSDIIKNLYYKFKLDNGVNIEYINLKENQLANIMFTKPIDWYITNLNAIFSNVEIINSRLGFITFLCFK
jgi:SAM-dependent methyltransferase